MSDAVVFENIQDVRNQTKDVLFDALECDSPVLIESPPGSGKTTAAFEAALRSDTPITYLAGRIDLYEQASEWANDQDDLTYETIPAPHRNCETFDADPESDGDHRTAWRLYNMGMSGRDIHFSSSIYTPCGKDCEYLRKLDRVDNEIEDIDLLIGHHNHSKRYQYSRNRIVILDEFNPDPFFTAFPDPTSGGSSVIDDPGEIISHFLDTVHSLPGDSPLDEFDDITDIVERRTDSEQVIEAVEWLAELGVTWSDVVEYEFFEPSAKQHDQTNFSAPLLTFGLFCMEKIAPGLEVAPGTSDEAIERWSLADLPSGYRCLRDRNTGAMYTLEPPDLRDAEQVVALDGTSTLPLWNLLFAPGEGFDHRQVIKRDQYPTYIESTLNMRVVQVGDGLHPAAGGLISRNDGHRMEAIARLEEEGFALISSKKTIAEYREQGWIDEYVKPIDTDSAEPAVRNFARVLSSNVFGEESLGCVFGAPHPGDDVIKRWAGLCGERAEASGEGMNKSFGEFGDEIFRHFVHKQVAQAIFRFGRDDSVRDAGGPTVYVSTLALPEWFPVHRYVEFFSGEATRAIVKELVEAAQSATSSDEAYHSRRSLNEALSGSSVDPSSRHVRKVLRKLRKYPFLTVHEGEGDEGANLYRWNGEGEFVALSSPTHFAIQYEAQPVDA